MTKLLKLRMYEPLEKEIQSSILEYLKAKRIFCWKEFSSGIMVGDKRTPRYMPIGLTGKSDILGIYKGKFLAIEVKRPSGVLSKAQEEFLFHVNRNGGIGFVATSIDDVVKHGI